ncbi:MAG TPA: MBL fold metallo-hydrolase [Woeseiaceae bacterium]
MRTIVLLVLAATSVAGAADNPFEATELAPGIFMLAGSGNEFVGGGVGLLVGDEYVVLIDDVIVPTAPQLLEKVQEIAGRPVDFVINTHVHGDHVGGNEQAAKNGAIIVAHDNLRRRMEADPKLNTGPGALPVITFSDNVTFHVNGQQAFVFHVAQAHTDGDAVIHFRDANVIAAGDISFRGIFPFIDLDSGGSVAGFKAAMRRVIEIADDETKIITGHGPAGTRAGVEQDLAMLVDAEARVKALVDQGLTADEIVAANPLADYHDEYNWAFITTERMTRTLIRSLTTD